ncbi:ricin-type beta-trefoil lectin domain protein [Roseateles saccharophilus]|nr:ricin-type beta-trefoil lectin domain protein [Roseateles saccharophilus]
MLRTSGRSVVDAAGNVVPQRGLNLGGWFVMEKWMSPLDSGSLPDTYSVMRTLNSRFGVAAQQALLKTYQQSWITASDLDNIKAAGFNTVRVPVWWGQFYPLDNVSNSGWRADAFDMLDWLVDACAQRGLYVVIVMHGAVGGQSASDTTGQANLNTYWTDANNQGNTGFMWWQIANHYKGNPTVAGYDLLNEPTGAPNAAAVISAYDSLYSTVRSADPDHIVYIEGTFGNWNWDMLPSPALHNWTNVVYQMHEYQYSNMSDASVRAGADKQVADFNNHASWNVPAYIGEFNDFGNGATTWQYTVDTYNNAGLSWTMWSYKATHGLPTDSWGFYDPTYWPQTPDISTDSQATIASKWAQWTTAKSFAKNPALGIDGGGVNGRGGIATGTWFNVVNVKSGLCIDAAGWGTANGTVLQQWACGSNQSNQGWQFQAVSGGVRKVVSRGAPGEVWDVTGAATTNGSPTQLWAYGGGGNQQWTPVLRADGYYQFVGLASGRCLAVAGGATTNGAGLQIADCDGSAQQGWKLAAQP